MKKIFCSFAICVFMIPDSSAQTTPLPYFEGFNPTVPPLGWQLIRKGASDPFYKWDIDSAHPFDGSSLFHNYPVGGTTATDDWYVSVPFSFASGGKIDSVRHYFSGFGFPQAGDTVAIYLLQGNTDPALATRTLLHDFRGASYVADNTWKKTANIIIPPAGGTAYIAFRYRTVANWLDVRFDNLGLSGNNVNSINSHYKAGLDFTVGPNPFTSRLTITTKEFFKWVRVYDALGKIVYSHSFRPVIHLSELPSGTYFMEFTDANQRKGTISITKQ